MSQKQNNGFHLKWYWWLLIAIIVLVIISGGTTGGLSKNPVAKAAGDVLGWAEGLMESIVSPWLKLLVGITIFPFLISGAISGGSKVWETYKARFKGDKTNAELKKEAGVDRESMEEKVKEAEKENPDATSEQIGKEVGKQSNREVLEKYIKDTQAQTAESMKGKTEAEINAAREQDIANVREEAAKTQDETGKSPDEAEDTYREEAEMPPRPVEG